MDSQVPPAAAAALRVASGQRARPAVYIQPSAVTISCFCFPALQTHWDDLWASGCRLIRAVLVKMCFGIYAGFFLGGWAFPVTHHSSVSTRSGRWTEESSGGRQARGWFQCNPPKPPFWKWFASNCRHLAFVTEHENRRFDYPKPSVVQRVRFWTVKCLLLILAPTFSAQNLLRYFFS